MQDVTAATVDPGQEFVQTDPDLPALERSLRSVIRSAADLAAFCEHVEHNERNDIAMAAAAGGTLRQTAVGLARASGVSLASLYRARLRGVEEGSILRHATLGTSPALAGVTMLELADTWEQVQVGQLVHDRQFHPDVFGLSKIDQIRHYTFHVTKLVGLLADAIDGSTWPSFRDARLADLAIFGVKISTVCNVRLDNELVDPGA